MEYLQQQMQTTNDNDIYSLFKMDVDTVLTHDVNTQSSPTSSPLPHATFPSSPTEPLDPALFGGATDLSPMMLQTEKLPLDFVHQLQAQEQQQHMQFAGDQHQQEQQQQQQDLVCGFLPDFSAAFDVNSILTDDNNNTSSSSSSSSSSCSASSSPCSTTTSVGSVSSPTIQQELLMMSNEQQEQQQQQQQQQEKPQVKQEQQETSSNKQQTKATTRSANTKQTSAAATTKRGRKRKHTEMDPPTLSFSREELLSMTSEKLEDYAKQITKQRALTDGEERELKRQRRLIKNRESAQLSRMRKKVYIEDLEQKVNVVVRQNEIMAQSMNQLEIENKQLRDEIYYLRNVIKQQPQQQQQLQDGVSLEKVGGVGDKLQQHGQDQKNKTNVKKAAVYLLVVLFSFGLLFNTNTPNTTTTTSQGGVGGAVSFPVLNKREAIPDVVPLAQRLYSGRVIQALEQQYAQQQQQHMDMSNLGGVGFGGGGGIGVGVGLSNMHAMDVESPSASSPQYNNRPYNFRASTTVVEETH